MNFIGVAGWNLARNISQQFAAEGSHLERYATRFNAVEINSSFYRHHQAKTYERWAAAVPAQFRFAVKLFRGVTHDKRLEVGREELREILEPISALGKNLGPLLVQLPPSLAFEETQVEKFFHELRAVFKGAIACEPRHITWLRKEARRIFTNYDIAKVFADPEPCPDLGCRFLDIGSVEYFRLHGSPEMYRSSYSEKDLEILAHEIRLNKGREHWVIFDNTTFGHAVVNALDLQKLLQNKKPELRKRSPGSSRASPIQ